MYVGNGIPPWGGTRHLLCIEAIIWWISGTPGTTWILFTDIDYLVCFLLFVDPAGRGYFPGRFFSDFFYQISRLYRVCRGCISSQRLWDYIYHSQPLLCCIKHRCMWYCCLQCTRYQVPWYQVSDRSNMTSNLTEYLSWASICLTTQRRLQDILLHTADEF